VIEKGVMAYDIIPSEPMKVETFDRARVFLQQNYGLDYPKEKFAMLFDLIREEGWTEARFQDTFKWFIKTKYNQAWTVSDWFQYGVKLYPIEWMKAEISKMGNPPNAWKKFDRYKIGGVFVCKFKDGVELPIEKME
jgi:hypothetical protein